MGYAESFKGIEIETNVSNCALRQERLEKAFPRLNPFDYSFTNNNGEQRFNITKWFRNVAMLDNFQAASIRLGEFFVAVEFFQESIRFERIENDFSQNYKRRFFLAVASDSLRSYLDILAKSTAWFYDLKSKETVGFAFKTYLKPIKPFSSPIFKSGNQIYRSKAFEIVKNFRDTEKHSGLAKRDFKLNISGKSFEAKITNPDPMDFQALEKACCELFNLILSFTEVCITEILKHDKGFSTPVDQICKIGKSGNLVCT